MCITSPLHQSTTPASATTLQTAAWRGRRERAPPPPARSTVEDSEEVGGRGQAGPRWPSPLPLTTSMGSTAAAFQAHQGYQTIHIYISQRPVLDSSVQLVWTGGRGTVQGAAALVQMRPCKTSTPPYTLKLPTVLRVCPVKSVCGLYQFSQSHVCGGRGGMGGVCKASQSSREEEQETAKQLASSVCILLNREPISSILGEGVCVFM